jgi:hypothetical protein
VLYQNAEILFIGNQAAPQPGETQAATNPGSNLITFDLPPGPAEKILFVAGKPDTSLSLLLVPPDNAPADIAPVTQTDLLAPDAKVTPCPANKVCTPYDQEAQK